MGEKMGIKNVSLANFIGFRDKDLLKKTQIFYGFTQEMKRRGYYAYRRPIDSPSDHRVIVDDPVTGQKREMIMMGCNNYLGLANHPKVIEAVEKALKKYGFGSTGSPLLTGTYTVHQELERRVAELKGCEDAVLFTSGYVANLGTITALLAQKDVAINDRLNHASIIDGCRLSGSVIEIFKHNDMVHLETILRYADERYDGKLVIVDGVYSMDGDLAPLSQIVEITKHYKAYLMVDEAHATGVVGPQGKGTLAYCNVEGKVDLVMITFSKALGCAGGAVASTKEVCEYLRFFSRSTFFSTHLPPAVAAGALAALDVLESEPERRKQLWDNITYMIKNLKSMGYTLGNTQSAIIPVIIGDDDKLREMGVKIHEAGIYLCAIPYPAVPRGQGRFRITIMATHTREDLDKTLDVLKRVGKKFGVLRKGGI
jgi:glycine C-acetyltransferase